MTDETENKIIDMLILQQEKIANIEAKMVTREEFLSVTDDIMTIVSRVDENMTFKSERMKRNERDIEQLKIHAGLA
ncbi:MAG: hypothetical protein WC045_01325 [Patescibacteria group bacterium]